MITLTTEQAQLIEIALMKIADLRNLGKIQPEVIAFETLYIIRAARAHEQAEQEIIPSWEEYCECEGIPCEPVKPVDLTDDEIYEVCKDVPFVVIGPDYDLAIARAVIAADREKNRG